MYYIDEVRDYKEVEIHIKKSKDQITDETTIAKIYTRIQRKIIQEPDSLQEIITERKKKELRIFGRKYEYEVTKVKKSRGKKKEKDKKDKKSPDIDNQDSIVGIQNIEPQEEIYSSEHEAHSQKKTKPQL